MKKNLLAKYLSLRVATTAANQMLTVAVGYQVYQLTGSKFLLGVIGLIQFLPKIIFIFNAGTISDRYDRRRIITVTQTAILLISLVLGFGSYLQLLHPYILLIAVFIYGTAFAIEGPAIVSLLPNLVERTEFPRVNAISSSFNQAASIIGPALAGLLYILGADFVYWSIVVFNVIAIVATFAIKSTDVRHSEAKRQIHTSNVKATLEGFRYIWQNKGILGALSLDMFAVLFGGVTALLPVFATDILHVGSTGFGILRAAPSIGAVLMAVYLAKNPLRRKAGKKMFAAVAIFGIITILFGLSREFYLSLGLLILLGAADQISMIVRSTFVQLKTPDEIRGRVSSVNLIFIGASNQLGEFESGTTAAFMGLIPATIFGGIMTLVVASLWFVKFDELRELDEI
ncbi:MFS transporter [Lactococcus insecticola]|uniref:MFS transporter n=1 Tax=Pseudolactococcus insecticola TaxID=2709158 RepID=A0A6A0B5Z6_9LACT|nr:MFS transporter [Lactococcus insecticola]GFH40135.1 MFS transporter [Lactococcus insecticola]